MHPKRNPIMKEPDIINPVKMMAIVMVCICNNYQETGDLMHKNTTQPAIHAFDILHEIFLLLIIHQYDISER